MKELNRVLRHAIAPVAAWAVAQGWLPETAKADVIEVAVVGLGYLIPLALSKAREAWA